MTAKSPRRRGSNGTAAPLRESGYLVKMSSLFIKRLEVTQETVLQDFIVASIQWGVSRWPGSGQTGE